MAYYLCIFTVKMSPPVPRTVHSSHHSATAHVGPWHQLVMDTRLQTQENRYRNRKLLSDQNLPLEQEMYAPISCSKLR